MTLHVYLMVLPDFGKELFHFQLLGGRSVSPLDLSNQEANICYYYFVILRH